MTKEGEHSGGANNPSKAGQHVRVATWKKPVTWVVTTAVAALGLAISGWLQQSFTDMISQASEIGNPVLINYAVVSTFEDVHFSKEIRFSGKDLEELNRIPTPDQETWLENHGGIVAGTKTVAVQIEGNRTRKVRITDVQASAECESPSGGTLVRIARGKGGTPKSIRMGIDVSETPSSPWWIDPESNTKKPYFPDKTITLEKGEAEYLVIDLNPGRHFCKVSIDMEVTVGTEKVHQVILDKDRSVAVLPPITNDDEVHYSNVYLGGEICDQYVTAPKDWIFMEDSGCGPGNIANSASH